MTTPTDPPEAPPRPRRGVRELLQATGRSLSTGGGRGEALGFFCEALLEAGVPALIVLISFLYSPQLSDYRIGKQAALHLMVGLLAGLWLVRAGIQGRLSLARLAFYRPVLVFLGLSLCSLALATNRLQGAEALLSQVWLLLLCLLAMHHVRDPAAASVTLWTAVLCGLGVALLGLLQYNGIHLVPTVFGDLPVSTLGNPNFVAHYLELLIPLILALLTVRRQRWEQALLWAALILTTAHLVVAASRAGWLALAVALGYWFWPRLAGVRRRLHQVLAAALVALLLSAPLGLVLDSVPNGQGQSLNQSLTQLGAGTWERALSGFDRQNFSVAQRLIIWSDTIALIADHPLLGVGPGNFELYLPAYRSLARHQEWKALMGERTNVAYEAENEYLEFAAEAGLPGLAAMLWLLGTLVWSGRRRLQHQIDPTLRTLTRGCLAGLIATLVHCLFSFNLQDPASATLFWLLGGLVVALNGGEPETRVIDLASPGRRAAVLAAGALLAAVGIGLGLSIAAGDYYYSNGRKLQAAGQPNRATLAYNQAIGWRGWDFRYHHSLGLARLEANRPAEADAPLRRSLALHPNNAAAMRLLGRSLWLQEKDGELAVAWLQRAVTLDPLNAQSYYWLARAQQLRQDHAGAIAAWEQAIALQPGDPEMLMSLALEYGSAGQYPRARQCLEQAARLAPQNPNILGNLGALYLKVGLLAQAEAPLRQAVSLAPAMPSWRYNLALVLAGQQRTAEALALCEPLLQANPSDEQLQRLVSSLRQRRQKDGP
ncbi:MAG: tetratricopeptide repeat protein [Candidatus Latescibacteria bacterium]|nr:tetratricopeptide repeat protein [Candidatus Latescibacterota bacterium]